MTRPCTAAFFRAAAVPRLGSCSGHAMRAACRGFATTSAVCARRDTGLLRSSFVALGAATRCTEALDADRFARLAPMVLLQRALDQHAALDGSEVARELDGEDVNRIIITRASFDKFCAECHVADSEAALTALSDAAVVVPLDDGQLVHLRPVRFAEEMDAIATLQTSGTAAADVLERVTLPRSFLLHQQQKQVAELTLKEEAMRTQLQPAIAKAARWRRSVWGGTIVFAGAQLAIISRLTFFDLDWDIMEPVSYIVTITTSLFFYIFFLRHDVEHTYTEFDRQYISKRVRKYAPKDFDWSGYQALCTQLDMERATLKFLEQWATTH